ncbi:CYTH-like domain-containing protein [Lineolata rhizophorae]|uniref:Thiamine-triphosphatase n=1 Tax=Lineolata rhizophorae TaxID=578093 RepID=A0A6A6NP54_9PEZI|nr:CYTH-like domain-containing protein [Lineolata rhizophorae]
MASRQGSKLSRVLEVERKFRSLAVRDLSQHGRFPHFRSLRKLPVQCLHDTYYDQSSLLSSAGAWVRRRNGAWQAKIKKGGTFNNSKFEELCDARDISSHITRITGTNKLEADNFGLLPIANFSTRRETWIADDEFHIALDIMDFGHEVGEVELQRVLHDIAGGGDLSEQQEQRLMQEMDEKISTFMKQYSWAFSPGEPKGKLTAYFERMRMKAI